METQQENQAVNEELMREAAAELGEPIPEGEPPQAGSEPQAQTTEPESGEPAKGQAPSTLDELREALKDTPYYQEGRDVKELVAELKKGYKELQGSHTKLSQKVKPIEQLLDRISNPQIARTIEQILPYVENPSLLQAYVNPQGQVVTGEPNPANYDLLTPEGQAQFQRDTLAYARQAAQEDVKAFTSRWEQQKQLELQKLEFKKQFPDVDPDTVLQEAQSKLAYQNPLVTAWKALNYDNLKSQAMEEARKELGKKLEDAAVNKTPQASAPTKAPNLNDILQYIASRGVEAAKKRYGSAKVDEAMRETVQFL